MSNRPRIPTARRTLATACAALLAVFGMAPALAVDVSAGTHFQLDGNAQDSTAAATLPDDWDSVFNLFGAVGGTAAAGAGESFVIDSQTGEAGFSGLSNKDIDQVNTWVYDNAKVTPDKDNITNAYAKAYTIDNHLVLYFGADRYSNNGDAALGFWFFRNSVGLGPKSGRSGPFTGSHAVGDVLVQVDYFQGGSQSRIEIFKWVASGGDVSANLQRVGTPTVSNGVTVCRDDHLACATSNMGSIPSPWAYSPKAGANNAFPNTSFFEGGIDVTALIGDVCFSSFMAETRTSHSETSELKDFALGDFDLCSVDVEKVCVVQAGISPVVDAVNETFQTKHTVRIENNGFGSLYGIQLQDNTVAAGTKDCSISQITGGINPTSVPAGGIPFTSGTQWQTIAGSLNAGAANGITVSLICITNANPFRNQVSLRASPSPGGIQDVVDMDLETVAEAAVCQATLNSGLALTKYCHGDSTRPGYVAGDLSVTLDPNSTPAFLPKVCVDIRLSSTTKDQRMVINSFSDSDLGSLLPAGGLTLAPKDSAGDSYSVSRCYTPAAPDNNAIIPHLVNYSDTVSASGTGKIDGVTATPLDVTATCPLCP